MWLLPRLARGLLNHLLEVGVVVGKGGVSLRVFPVFAPRLCGGFRVIGEAQSKTLQTKVILARARFDGGHDETARKRSDSLYFSLPFTNPVVSHSLEINFIKLKIALPKQVLYQSPNSICFTFFVFFVFLTFFKISRLFL